MENSVGDDDVDDGVIVNVDAEERCDAFLLAQDWE